MKTRKLVVFERLPDRSAMTPAERLLVLTSDVTDTANKARAKLEARATRFTVTGWTGNPDDIYVAQGEKGTIVASYELSRPD